MLIPKAKWYSFFYIPPPPTYIRLPTCFLLLLETSGWITEHHTKIPTGLNKLLNYVVHVLFSPK